MLLKLKNYVNEVRELTLENLKDEYHQTNMRYRQAIEDKTIVDKIIEYLVKHNFRYNTKNTQVRIDNEFYCQYSNPKDYPKTIEECEQDFIWTAKCEVLNLIQNTYFNKETLTYNYNK